MMYEMHHKISLVFFLHLESKREGFQTRTACSNELRIMKEAVVDAGQVELVHRNDIWPFEQDA